MKIEFDENNTGLSYGYFRCDDCKSEWYGGVAIHDKANCDLNKLVYVIGSKAAAKIMEYGNQYSLNLINAKELRAALPEIAERFSK